MSGTRQVQVRRWVTAIVASLVALKATAFVLTRLLGFTRREVEARGGDVAFVIGLAERRLGH